MRVLTWLLCVLAPGVILAQDATIQGVVTDQSGAMVAGARIKVTNGGTGIAQTLETNAQGAYAVPFLTPGTYRIEAAKPGFATVTRENLKLDVEQTARVDFTLRVGSVIETVEVSSAAALLDSQTSAVGQVIDNKRIVELPLNGRNYLELARLTSAVAPSSGARPDSKGSFSALGQHAYQTNILLDGIDNNSRASGGQLGYEAQAVTPSIDSVAEFKVVTNNNSAEYGFRMGGTVIVSTRSGTNHFHGSLWEFLRNDKLDGTNFFSVGQPKPPYRRNQFGGALGGPIFRNRTFFFGSYEGTRIRRGGSSISTVPIAALREGDFSTSKPLFDPLSTTQNAAGAWVRSPFSGNRIPASRFDPVARSVIALYPTPNLPGVVNNYYFSGSHADDSGELDTRFDHNISDKLRAFVRYSRRINDVIDPGNLPLPADGGSWQTINLAAHSIAASLNQTLTPSANNEFRFGYSRIVSLLDIPWTDNYNAKLDIKGAPDLGEETRRGMARFSPTGYSQVGARSFWPNKNNLDLLQFSDTLLVVRGRHSLKTGFDFHQEEIFRRATRLARGLFSFDGSFTQDPMSRGNTGDGMADFLMGLASGGTLGNFNGETARTRNYSAFLQDDWRITPRLTLNLGLRWDWFGPPSFHDKSAVNIFVLDPHSPNFQSFVRPSGESDCGCQHDWNNFAPRVGFAWQLNPKTVIRSGFGLFYGEPDAIAHDGDARFYNQVPDFTEINFPTDRLLQPSLVVSQGFPSGLLPTTVIQENSAIRSANRFIPSQYSAQWFFDIERELPASTLLALSYIGSGTRHLLQNLNVNQPLTPGAGAIKQRGPRPFFSSVRILEPVNSANYEAFTAKAEKRYSRGITFLASYTWSHNIDLAEGTYEEGTLVQNNYDLRRNRGSSVFDRRHQFVLSGIYDLPFGAGRTWLNRRGAVDWLLGGWQLGAILSLRTGQAFTPQVSTDISNTGTNNRPNRRGSGSLAADQRSIQRWFDTSVFTIPDQYTYGNGGRNILIGPRLRNMDLKIGKNFALTEHKRLQFRCEMFNFSNTPHFGNPNPNINLPQGGKITSASAPRQIQFGLKFVF